jgi:hypothetical protein
MKKTVYFILVFMLLARSGWAHEEDEIPRHLSVLPVFFVPDGETAPTPQHIDMVVRHLEIAQGCYKKMLKERDTFSIADLEPQILQDRFTLPHLKKLDDKLSQYLINRLFKNFTVNRFNCPFVFVVIIMCPEDPWPTAGGRPINPGFNSGGGIVIISSNDLVQESPNIQGCLQHELGHAFGLVHVDSYGCDQHTNKSIMSFNVTNKWAGYDPPKEPGILIPEDIRGLSMNKRVFPALFFDSSIDVPSGYKSGKLIRLSFDGTILGQKPYEIKAASACGQVNETRPENIVIGYILPNRKSKTETGLNSDNMWMSGKAQNGWVDLELEFPIAVRLDQIRVHSQCGGGLYPVKAMKVEVNQEGFKEVIAIDNIPTDATDIRFDEVKSQTWRLYFKPDESGQVVIRGLQFFYSGGEIFCPKFPTYLMHSDTWTKN